MKRARKNSLLTLSLLVAAPVFGQVAADNSYSGDTINIEAYQKEKMVSDRELETIKAELQRQKNTINLDKQKSSSLKELTRTTEKLSDVREEMIEEKIDSQKAIAEHNKKFKEAEDRLKCLEANNWDRSKCPKSGNYVEDIVESKQSAMKNEVSLEEISEDSSVVDPTFMVTPFVGMGMYQGEFQGESDNFESKFAVGLKGESKIHRRVGVGVGFSYTSMSIYQTPSLYGQYFGAYNYGFSNNGYLGREMEYTNFSGDIYSKFYLVVESRFRPYAGAGLGFRRTRLQFTDTSATPGYYSYSNQVSSLETDGYLSNALTGELMAGVDIEFTKLLGLNLELKYVRGLTATSSASTNAYNMYAYGTSYSQIHDQYFVEELGREIDDANNIVLTTGLNISF